MMLLLNLILFRLKFLRYVLTFFFSLAPATQSSADGAETLTSVQLANRQNLTPGDDLIVGDNWSPFDLQIYGKYYESIGAAQLQPQKSKRLFVNGALVDFDEDNALVESSVIPVPDAAKVVLAPQRSQTTAIWSADGTHQTGSVTQTSGGTIFNGAKRDVEAAGLSSDLRDDL